MRDECRWYVRDASKMHQSDLSLEFCLCLFETLSDVERQEADRLTVLEPDGYLKNIAISFDALRSDTIYWYDIQR